MNRQEAKETVYQWLCAEYDCPMGFRFHEVLEDEITLHIWYGDNMEDYEVAVVGSSRIYDVFHQLFDDGDDDEVWF